MGIFDFFRKGRREKPAPQPEQAQAASVPGATTGPEQPAVKQPAPQPEWPQVTSAPGPATAPAPQEPAASAPEQPAADKPAADDGPDPKMRLQHRLTVVLQQKPSNQEIALDPTAAERTFNSLLTDRMRLVGVRCRITVEKAAKDQPPVIRLNAALGNALYLMPPDELKARIASLSFADKCLFARLLWMDEVDAQEHGRHSLSGLVLNHVLEALDAEEVLSGVPLWLLRRFLHEAQAPKKPDQAYVDQLMAAVARAMKNARILFVAYDALVRGGRFPFIDHDGRAVMFTSLQTMVAGRTVYEQQKAGRLETKTLSGSDIPAYFATLRDLGLSLIRLDNGSGPVEVRLDLLAPEASPELADQTGRSVRGLMLREMQIAARMQAFPAEKGSAQEKSNWFWLLTCRYNSYSRMGQGLFYVLAPRGGRSDDVTWHTAAARDHAAHLAEHNPDSRLQAPWTDSAQLYDGPLTLRVANKPGSTAVADGCVCVFTSRAKAMEVLDRFRKAGCDDLPVLVTFDELMTQAERCAGILVDMGDLAMEIAKAAYGDLKTYATMNGPIIVNLK